MDTLMSVVLVVLAAAGVWAVVEIALLLRISRRAVEQAAKSVSESGAKIEALADRAVPLIEHADQVVSQAGPALGDVRPLLDRVGNAVETLNTDLEHVSDILGDAARITGAASNATTAVEGATSAVAGKFRGLFGKKGAASAAAETPALQEPRAESGETPEVTEDVRVDRPNVISFDSGYFTYPDQDVDKPAQASDAGAADRSAGQDEPGPTTAAQDSR